MTPEGISTIERDKVNVSLPTIRKLSAVLQKPINYLGKFEDLPEGTFGEKLTKARLYRGMTKSELARELNVDVKSIHNWESNKRVPSNKVRITITDLFHMN